MPTEQIHSLDINGKVEVTCFAFALDFFILSSKVIICTIYLFFFIFTRRVYSGIELLTRWMYCREFDYFEDMYEYCMIRASTLGEKHPNRSCDIQKQSKRKNQAHPVKTRQSRVQIRMSTWLNMAELVLWMALWTSFCPMTGGTLQKLDTQLPHREGNRLSPINHHQ